MKNLKEYIVEGIFDIDDNIDKVDESVKDQIMRFLKDNFDGSSSCKISNKPNADGKYEVSSSKDITVKNEKLTSLTNGMFIWIKVGGFYCGSCRSLTSLEGAPEKVDGIFYCGLCDSLTSLKGAPKKVGGGFYCSCCRSLTSLEGAPKEVRGDFYCNKCTSLTLLEGAPKEVRGDFDCNDCTSLTSLKGAPKYVGRDFSCNYCCFTVDDVEEVSNVNGNIYV